MPKKCIPTKPVSPALKPTPTPTTMGDVKRIMSDVAEQNYGKVPKGHFVGRMQRTLEAAKKKP